MARKTTLFGLVTPARKPALTEPRPLEGGGAKAAARARLRRLARSAFTPRWTRYAAPAPVATRFSQETAPPP